MLTADLHFVSRFLCNKVLTHLVSRKNMWYWTVDNGRVNVEFICEYFARMVEVVPKLRVNLAEVRG
jgi:hypothetical protein